MKLLLLTRLIYRFARFIVKAVLRPTGSPVGVIKKGLNLLRYATGMGKRTDEDRHPVLIRAKMWDGARHADVCVRNISALGMMLQTATPPVVGSYVEISGGGVCAVGRVAWSSKHKFGIRTRDRNDLRELIGEAARMVTRAYGKARSSATPEDSLQSSRLFARSLDFVLVVSLGVALASLASAGSFTMLDAPLRAVARFLG